MLAPTKLNRILHKKSFKPTLKSSKWKANSKRDLIKVNKRNISIFDPSYGLEGELLQIQNMAYQFANEKMLPHAPKWDAEEYFPIDTLREAAELGFGGVYVKEDVGGTGLGRYEAAIVFESLATACPSTTSYITIHNMVAGIIDRFGTNEQRMKYLPDLCSMQKFASYCLTEPGSGSDAASLKTKAEKKGDHYVLNGEKAFISGGGSSDVYLIMARTGDQSPKGISAFIVEKDFPGIRFGKKEHKLGWNSQPTRAVILENCIVPAENLLGNEGDGFKIAMIALDGGRINIAASSLGGAYTCFKQARDHALVRKQFGKELASLQSIQFKLADMGSSLYSSRLLVRDAAQKLDNNDPNATVSCAIAKQITTDKCFNVCNEALQILGGYGYLKEFPIERYLRDLRVHQILEGTNEIMRVIISRRALKDELS